MKYKILIIFTLVSLHGISQYKCDESIIKDDEIDTTYSGVCEENYPSGKIHYRVNYYNGNRHGLFEEFYENGDIKATANYVKWDIVGTAERYYPNGQLMLIITLDSLGNGKLKRFYEDGSIHTKGTFFKGFRSGVWTKYDRQGDVIFEKKENQYEKIVESQKKADKQNENPDRDYDVVIDWEWDVETEFFKEVNP